MEGLEFVTTEELLEELQGRYDFAVFAGYRYLSDNQCGTSVDWKGGAVPCIGLAEYAKQRLSHSAAVDQIDDGDAEPPE